LGYNEAYFERISHAEISLALNYLSAGRMRWRAGRAAA
jgi:hypothetical protein